MGDHPFRDESLLSINDNEVSFYKEGYGQVLVGGMLASRGANNLIQPSYLVEGHGGPNPVYARLEVLPPYRSWLLLVIRCVPVSDVTGESCNLPHCFSDAPLDLLTYIWVGGGHSLVPCPPSGERGWTTGSEGCLFLLLMSLTL